MSQASPHGDAADECRAFGRYLSGADPTPYVRSAYLRLLPSADVGAGVDGLLIERALIRSAHSGAPWLRVADAYARFFRPRSLLRRRLILLLAILESSAPAERRLNTGDEGSAGGVIARLVVSLIASGVCLIAGVLIFGPVHLASGRAAHQQATS